MKRGVSTVSAWCLFFSLCTAALAQVAYPEALGALAPAYPGATVIMAGKDGQNIQVMLHSTEAPEKIMAFYREKLTAKGFKSVQELDMVQVKTVVFERDGAELAVSIMPQEGGPAVITLAMQTGS